jgi:hypothetical protein
MSWMKQQFLARGIQSRRPSNFPITGYIGGPWRKPGPGMLLQTAEDFSFTRYHPPPGAEYLATASSATTWLAAFNFCISAVMKI